MGVSPPLTLVNSTSRPGKEFLRWSASRKVSLKSTVLSWLGMLPLCAAAGSPYPRKMSCSHSGTTQSLFIRSRMHSRIALKLFSLGLRRISMFNPSYTSSPCSSTRRFTSSWYCAVSSARTYTRSLPWGPPASFERPLKSLYSFPAPSRTSITSAPRTYLSPKRSAGLGSSSRPCWGCRCCPCCCRCWCCALWPLWKVSEGPSAAMRKSTSCCLIWSHSSRTGPRRLLRSMRTSHVTPAGFASPTLGLRTSVTASAPEVTGSAMRAHPLNFT
mmetsp:Transcript_23583/g.57788  ORF Transcript_23583/g.57788 Transcript_23583/m.57788 type:complete len:272 (-) Transcript_23583:2026-2841(-)